MGAISQADVDYLHEAASRPKSSDEFVSDKDLEDFHAETRKHIQEFEDAHAELPPAVANFQGKSLAEALPNDYERAQQRTPEETAALKDYRLNGYVPINSYLRKGQAKQPGYGTTDIKTDKTNDQAQAAVEQIDKAMANSTLQAPMTLYRGVDLPRGERESLGVWKDAWSDIRPGSMITDPGYQSTSGQREAGGFGKFGAEYFGGSGAQGYILTIQAPAGTHAIAMDRYSPPGPSRTESEVMLARGTQLEVHKVVRSATGPTEILASVKQA
jgi:hypothetical protein